MGPHNAEDMVSDFHLGVYKGAPIFWHIDTGGPVSTLNANNLKSSGFISGAFPAEYANVTGAVLDLKLRNGNSNKYEFLGKIRFNGVEFGTEGPINGIGDNASFLINYRYPTLQVFDILSLDLGTGI